MRRGTAAFLLLALVGCTSTYAPAVEDAGVYEVVFARMIAEYDALPEQFDDPVGRTYCLAFQSSPGADYRAFGTEFMTRFAAHQNVRPAGYCRNHGGRWMVVSRIERQDDGATASVWSLSKVTSRSGYATCLNTLQRVGSMWKAQDCKDGRIYN